jgi:hypothetical protein
VTYNSFGDVEAAKKYAKLAAETVAMKEMPGIAEFEVYKALMNDPEGHWSWRSRIH